MASTTVRTTDLVLAASLVANKHKLDDIVMNALGRGTFVFSSVDERTLIAFNSGGMLVEPKEFDQARVLLTRMCRNRK